MHLALGSAQIELGRGLLLLNNSLDRPHADGRSGLGPKGIRACAAAQALLDPDRA